MYICKGRITLLKVKGFETYEKGETIESLTEDETKELLERDLIYEMASRQVCEGDSIEIQFLLPDKVRKMKKKDDLIEYGITIGIDTLSNDMKVEELVNAILDYTEEMQQKNTSGAGE